MTESDPELDPPAAERPTAEPSAVGTPAADEPDDERRSLGRATTVITIWNLVSRLTGFVRVMATTAALGVTVLGDTYQRTSQVSNVLFELLAGGMLFSVLVPTYVQELRRGGRDDARHLASALATRGVVALGVLVAVGMACSRPIVSLLSAGADPASRQAQVELGTFLLLFILPQLLLYLIGSVSSALLQADSRFAATSLAPVLNNVVVTATMIAFTVMHDPADGLSLSSAEKLVLGAGTLAGTLAMTVVPLIALRHAGLGLRPRWKVTTKGLGGLARRGLWGAGHVGLNEVLVMATVVLTGWVDGGVIAYQTAFTFFLLPHAILAHPIFTAIYPQLARRGADGDHREFADSLAGGLRSMFFLLLPAGGLIAVAAMPGLSAVHLGELSGSGARVVALVLASYLLGIAGYSSFFLLTRASYALDDPKSPTLVNVGVTAGTVVGMVVATQVWDGTGLLIAFGVITSVFAVAGSVALHRIVRRQLGCPVPVLATILKSSVAAIAATAIAASVASLVGWDHRLQALASALGAVASGLVVYVAILDALGSDELAVWRRRLARLSAPLQRLLAGRRGVRLIQVALILLIVALLGGSLLFNRARAPRTQEVSDRVQKVVVFTVPGLTVDDVADTVMPHLHALSTKGAIAVANVRTGSDGPDLVGSYSSLGAGNRTAGSETPVLVFPADAPIGADLTAAEAVEQQSGAPVTGDLVIANFVELALDVTPAGGSSAGALGDAMQQAGKGVGVVSNAASGPITTPPYVTPVAMAASTSNGSITTGVVDGRLSRTVVDPAGEETETAIPAEYAKAVRSIQKQADVVFVDAGETVRAEELIDRRELLAEATAATSTTTTPGASTPPVTVPEPVAPDTSEVREAALHRTDEVINAVRRNLAPGTMFVVLGIAQEGERWPLTPVVVSGPGVPHGYLDSGSTHRPGLVTLTDLAPTILDSIGVTPPVSMIGQPLRYRVGNATWSEAQQLDQLVANRSSADWTMTKAFVGANLAVYGLVLGFWVRFRRLPSGMRPLFELGALTCGAWPVSTYLLRMGTSLYSQGWTSLVLSWAIALVLALVASRLRGHRLDPVLAVALVTVAVIVIDLATGAHLQVGSFFGYMPHTAPRFVGLGNSGFSILAGAAMVAIGAIILRSGARPNAWWLCAGLAAVVVLVDGAPWMGTDVGGILALVPVFTLALWALRGNKIRWQTIAIAVIAGAAVLAVAVGVDALRPSDQRTHIGRFFLDAGEGSNFRDTIRRKWDLNLANMRKNPIIWSIPVLAAVAVVASRRVRSLRRLLPPGSAQQVTVLATLAAGTLGWLVNDSGVMVLALTCVPLGPFLVLLSRPTVSVDTDPSTVSADQPDTAPAHASVEAAATSGELP